MAAAAIGEGAVGLELARKVMMISNDANALRRVVFGTNVIEISVGFTPSMPEMVSLSAASFVWSKVPSIGMTTLVAVVGHCCAVFVKSIVTAKPEMDQVTEVMEDEALNVVVMLCVPASKFVVGTVVSAPADVVKRLLGPAAMV